MSCIADPAINNLIAEAVTRATLAERERCFDQFKESKIVEEAILNERERCAKVCDNGVDTEHPTVKGHIMKRFGASTLLAKAIRKGE